MSAQESTLGAGAQAPPPAIAAETSDVSTDSTTDSLESVDTSMGTAAQSGADTSNEPLDLSDQAVQEDSQVTLGELDLEPPRYRTAEDIDKQYQRVSKEARADLVNEIKLRMEAETRFDKLGGEEAFQVLAEIAPVIRNPAPQGEDISSFLATMSQMNMPLMIGVYQDFKEGVLSDEAELAGFLGEGLQKKYGYSLEQIDRLIDYDRAAPLTDEEFERTVGSGQPSVREQQTEAKYNALEAKYNALEARVGKGDSEKQTAQQQARTQAVQQIDKYVVDTTMERIAPVVERLGLALKKGEENTPIGKAKITFGKLIVPYLNSVIFAQPEYERVGKLREQPHLAFENGQPSGLLSTNVRPLNAKGYGLFIEAVRELQPLFKFQAKAKPQTPNADDPPAVPPLRKPEPEQTPDAKSQLDEVWGSYNAKVKDAQVVAGLRR